MPYYTKVFDVTPGATGRSQPVEDEFALIEAGFTSAETAIALKAPLNSAALTGTPTAPTPTTGDSSTKIATTAFVAATAFSAVLPAQLGNGGKYLTTDGTNASWALNLPDQSGNAGKFLKTDGSVAAWEYAKPVYVLVSSPTTAVNGGAYAIRTNAAAPSFSLPASPAANDVVYVMDADNNAVANNITIGRNGSTIMDLSEDMTISHSGVSVTLQYINASWRLV